VETGGMRAGESGPGSFAAVGQWAAASGRGAGLQKMIAQTPCQRATPPQVSASCTARSRERGV